MGVDHERATATGPRLCRDRPGYITVKTYVVMRRVHHSSRERPNIEILDVKLTQGAAQALVDANAGTWFEKVVADKRAIVTKRG